MRIHQEITERICYVERFEVLISGKPRTIQSAEYPFSRAANRQMPVSKWLKTRFASTYPDFQARVIYPDGTKVPSDIPIGIVRDAYQKHYIFYGKSLTFKFFSDYESPILKLKSSLDQAGIKTEFSRSSFLWVWEWFTLKGEIQHIHLPFVYRLELLSILNSLTQSEDVCLEYSFSSESHYLFEASSDYIHFGLGQFETLKSMSRQ